MTLLESTVSPIPRTHELRDPSGDVLFVRDWGPLDGTPVIHHHGTPSSGLSVPAGWTAPDALGIRVITFDRPGYGKSSNRPGRQVVDAAKWTERIADGLGLGELALLGTSGGGPHAAAAAAVLGDRVRRLCLLAGLGPDEMPGFDPAAGMVAETRQEIACARAGETLLRAFIDELMMRPDPLDDWLSQLPPSDVEILGRGEVRIEDQAIQAEAMRQGPEGWIEDDLALFHRPWGFHLGDVKAETLLLYGFEDVLVPANHGDAYVMELGHGQLVKIPDAGHWMRDYESDVLNWLVSPAQGPAKIIG